MSVAKSLSPQKKEEQKESTIGVVIDEAAERLPKYAKYIKASKPYVIATADGIDRAWPYCVKAYDTGKDIWVKLQPYDPEQFFPLIFGLVLCFFGGSYLTLIAAFEAVRLTVWDKLYTSISEMYRNYEAARDASAKDDAVDDNDDGIPDVQQISKKELVTRKFYVVAKAMNPEKMSEALGLMWAATVSVVATLRVQFAQAITLGCSMGMILHKHFDKSVLPIVTGLLPSELQKWAPVLSKYAFRTVGITCAWFMLRVISGFHAAIRGGTLFVSNAIILAKKHGYLDASFEEESVQTNAVAMAVAMFGFYWQLSNGFGLPFPLNLLLFPVSIVEWLLEYAVGL